jgi:murein DD-endopeptidase MepM/ murein hydrolase activator NlpD/uncharacterized protein YraI
MLSISQSVGRNGVNNIADVRIVQSLLNQNQYLLIPSLQLDESGTVDDATINVIEMFQRRVVLLNSPDGRVDPNGRTIARLNETARDLPPSIPLFPLKRRPTARFSPPNAGGRNFGAPRSGGRLHAGCDLLQPVGTEVRAIEDGTVIQPPYIFFDNTIALEVDHGRFVARYTEMSRTASGIGRTGVQVKRGQVLGFVGRLNSGASMLHFELYSGTTEGGLTDRSNAPYQRRSDLLDPTEFLEVATLDDTPNPIPVEGRLDGKVSSRVTSFLNVRSDSNGSADSIATLQPGSRVVVLENRIGGSYDANGSTRNDWFRIEFAGGTGFVAAFFIDIETQTGRVNSTVTSQLNLRETPFLSGEVIAGLLPGTTFRILGRESGGNYDVGDGTVRDDWLEIQYNDQNGFVAGFYVDVVSGDVVSDEEDPNAILFTYTPTGASDGTASQDNLPTQGIRGVQASIEMASTDRERILSFKERFISAAQMYSLPPALLAAIASRESRGGNVLDRNGFGDGGNAFGIMQVDRRFHRVETSGGPSGQEHIDQAASILREKLLGVETQLDNLSESSQLQTAISRYNGGRGLPAPRSDVGTTGGDYMNDVWARARYYAEQETWV